MTIRKSIYYSLLIPQAIGQLVLFIGFRDEKAEFRIYYTFSILLVSVIGLIFGVLISVLFRTPRKERWFYACGQLIAFAILMGFIIKKNTKLADREEKFRNASNSYLYLYQDSLPFNMKNEKIAIEKLSSKFKKPNSFLLTSLYTFPRDTTISGKKSTAYEIYLAYDTIESDSLFSKIILLNDRAYIEKFNTYANTDEEFQRILSEIPREFKKTPDSAKHVTEIEH